MNKSKHRFAGVLLVTSVCVTAAACSHLPDLPTDPADRCEALGGVAMTLPPTLGSDGMVTPGKFDHCMRDVHASEEDVRRARRTWHERHNERSNGS